MDESKLAEIKSLMAETRDLLQCRLAGKQITDQAETWVLYQVAFDQSYDKRLQLIHLVMNSLTELIAAAESLQCLQKKVEENVDSEILTKKLVIELIDAAIAAHKAANHSILRG